MDAGLEVPVAGEDGGADEVALVNGFFDGGVERSGVADTGGAAVADGLESELIEFLLKICGLKVIGDDPGTRPEGGLDIRGDGEATFVGFFCDQAGCEHDGRVAGVGATGDGRDEDGPVPELGVDGIEGFTSRNFGRSRAVGDHFRLVHFCSGLGVIKERSDGDACGLGHVNVDDRIAGLGWAPIAPFGGRCFEEDVKPFSEGGDVDAVLRALGSGDGGDHGGEVEGKVIGVVDVAFLWDAPQFLGAKVVFDGAAKFLAAAGAAEVVDGLVVDGEEAHGGAVFWGHIGDGGAVGEAEGLGSRAVEFHEFSNDTVGSENFGDAKGEIGRGDAFVEFAVEINADDFRDEEGDGLSEHACFGFDATHAPTNDAEAIDHGGVGIGADEGIGVENVVLIENSFCEILEIDLVDDTDSRRDHSESIEGLLSPLQEFVAFLVTDELDGEVAVEGVLRTGEIDLDGVIDDEIDGDEGFDDRGIGSGRFCGVAHRGEVDDEGNAGEVLQNDAGDGEGDFIIAGGFGVPGGEIFNVRLGDFPTVEIAEEGFENDADGDGEAGDVGNAEFLEGGEGVE